MFEVVPRSFCLAGVMGFCEVPFMLRYTQDNTLSEWREASRILQICRLFLFEHEFSRVGVMVLKVVYSHVC